MTSNDTAIEFPIASTRLRSLILRKHMSTLYTQLSQAKKADPNLTRMFLLNMFHILQINKLISCNTLNCINIQIPSHKLLQTRTPLEKEKLVSYWTSDDNDFTDDELQKDPPEARRDQKSPYKT